MEITSYSEKRCCGGIEKIVIHFTSELSEADLVYLSAFGRVNKSHNYFRIVCEEAVIIGTLQTKKLTIRGASRHKILTEIKEKYDGQNSK